MVFDEGYWRRHCEGFRVESHEGGKRRRLGVVEDVLLDASEQELSAIVVRGGLLGQRLTVIPAALITGIDPRAERLAVTAEHELEPWRHPGELVGDLAGRVRDVSASTPVTPAAHRSSGAAAGSLE